MIPFLTKETLNRRRNKRNHVARTTANGDAEELGVTSTIDEEFLPWRVALSCSHRIKAISSGFPNAFGLAVHSASLAEVEDGSNVSRTEQIYAA